MNASTKRGSAPRFSVVIPAYNAGDTLECCLQALERQTVPRAAYEVIAVNDGSTDDTAEVVRRHPQVELLDQANAGPAAARNRGAQAARGEILLFTDADCEPAPDWIERMVEPFTDPEIAGAKGVYRTRQEERVARFVQLEYEDKYDRMSRRERIDFIDTYSAAYRRDLFLENEGFDTVFTTASVEDQELSFRLARKGYQFVFLPQAAVYHQHDRTVREYWRRKVGIGYWKALLLRWHPERLVQDSHTPQVLKVQMLLVALLLALAVPALLWPPARWAALVTGLVFLLTAFPFLFQTARRDLAVTAVAPFLLFVRGLALGLGLVRGFLRFSRSPSPRQAPISGLDRAIKRAIDLVGSAIGLVLFAPLLPILALAIKLDSPGPVFFVQERAGENGRPFQMVKLRTMVEGAEEMLPDLIDLETPSNSTLKLEDDPRVTRVGWFLRHTSIDEVPQLWNVLKGDMSLVGPRPEETRIVRHYSDWHRQRLAVKPGITGPMQVNGRAELDLDERVALDLVYIRDYSVWKDLVILVKTVIAVLTGRGAY